MKFKKIVGFGDSWMWGDELLDPDLPDCQHPVEIKNTKYREANCFLGLLSAHYNLPAENFGIPGGSLNSTIWTYLWWLENKTESIEDCLILIALPFSNRWTFYDPRREITNNDQAWNRYVHGAWINSDSDCYNKQWTDTVKNLYLLSDCAELQRLNFLHTTIFFEGQHAMHHGNLIQFRTFEKLNNFSYPVKLKSMIQPDCSLLEILKINPDYHSLIAPQKHPNERGHQLIAQHLINYVDSYIIKQ